MDYQLYENTDILLNENSNSKNSWSMESNGELFGWNPLKINQEADMKGVRKRKLSAERSPKQVDKDPLSLDVKKISKRENIRKGRYLHMVNFIFCSCYNVVNLLDNICNTSGIHSGALFYSTLHPKYTRYFLSNNILACNLS